MIKASLLGDAASMPLHWIYDQRVIASKLHEHSLEKDSSFFPTPSCPYYNYPSGVFSPYGDESVPILKSMVQSPSAEFEVTPACEEIYKFYRSYAEEGDKGYVGRLNHVTKTFVSERDAGKEWSQCAADDSQANGIAKVALIVARYAGAAGNTGAGAEEMEKKVESMVRILQANDLSVSCSLLTARLLEKILLSSVGNSPQEITSQALQALLRESHGQTTSWTRLQKNILALSSSDSVMREWVGMAKAIDNTPASTPEDAADAWRTARIKGKLLSFLLNHRDLCQDTTANLEECRFSELLSSVLTSSHADADTNVEILPLDEKEKQTVTTAYETFVTTSHPEELAFVDVAKAVGMSCALPGMFLTFGIVPVYMLSVSFFFLFLFTSILTKKVHSSIPYSLFARPTVLSMLFMRII
jgi:hypothetical protein